jgi:hypothetical protein
VNFLSGTCNFHLQLPILILIMDQYGSKLKRPQTILSGMGEWQMMKRKNSEGCYSDLTQVKSRQSPGGRKMNKTLSWQPVSWSGFGVTSLRIWVKKITARPAFQCFIVDQYNWKSEIPDKFSEYLRYRILRKNYPTVYGLAIDHSHDLNVRCSYFILKDLLKNKD